MEPSGHISVIIKGKTIAGDLNPKDIDIAETREILTDVEMLLFPTKTERIERPKVAYEVKEGSVKNTFYLPLAKAIMFSALIAEIGSHGNIELLDPKAAAIIDKWQRKSYQSEWEYIITSSVSEDRSLMTINNTSEFILAQSDWADTSLYLYGKIYEEGGLSKINLHIVTDRFGKLIVNATEDQLTSGEQKLFKVYGLWVKGKQNIATGQLKDLELIDYLKYKPEYEEIALQKRIKKATSNWSTIKDKDEWLSEIRGGANE